VEIVQGAEMIRAIEPIWQGFRYKWMRLPHRVSRLVSAILDEDDGTWRSHFELRPGLYDDGVILDPHLQLLRLEGVAATTGLLLLEDEDRPSDGKDGQPPASRRVALAEARYPVALDEIWTAELEDTPSSRLVCCAVLRGFSWTLSSKAPRSMIWPIQFHVSVEAELDAAGAPAVIARFEAQHGNAPDPFHDPVQFATTHRVAVGYTLFVGPIDTLRAVPMRVRHSGPVDVARKVPTLAIRRRGVPGFQGAVAGIAGFGFHLHSDRPKAGRHLMEMAFHVADGPYDPEDGWKHLKIGAGVRGVTAVAAATHESYLDLLLLHYRDGKQLPETLVPRRRFAPAALKDPDRKDIPIGPELIG
jgi:hypothetical protein